MRVTSLDVARAAGVSQSTVSRALRGHPGIPPETVRRVREAAAALNYIPSDRARDLATRSTRRVAMVVDLDNPLWSLLVGRLYDELARHRYRLTLIAEHGDPEDIESHVLGGSVDGVIVSTAARGSRLPEVLHDREVPTVLLHRYAEDVRLDASVADDRLGARSAARILLEAGHRRIGALLGPSSASTGRDRAAGFHDALAEAGVEAAPEHVRHGGFTFEHGRSAVTEMAAAGTLPDALFCANDMIALGAMNAAHELGLRVPGDLALVGFDDLAEAAWPLVGLTTIRVPFEDMLRSAVDLLLERITGFRGGPRRVVHPVEPVLRSSHRRA
ncbi:LacI family DNA-binding transcriptional regulator [Thermomonospora catenispora]|mgnify:CR=1 FL=1|uniref:LacI family DNA-binding transcriptional regulator n=1 Tax=Thermomonospora catenispora TaxID=2493090 RepID=UPI00111FAC84|nr:LacI family DNA-binding transcriptional regulator [Thermomonospora catenispora]TNY35497.1 LacI family transcriptional regulator [Thermomonospora catenispora]